MTMKRKRYKTDEQLKDLAQMLSYENPKRDILFYYYQMKKNILGEGIRVMTEKKARRIFGM